MTVFLVVFGFGMRMQLAFIMFSIIWPVLLNTADGARAVEPLYLETGRAFRLSRRERVLRIVLPAALPKVFAGLRLALSLSLIVTVFAELLPGTTNGIGFQLTVAYSMFNLPSDVGRDRAPGRPGLSAERGVPGRRAPRARLASRPRDGGHLT
ncbi:ABC transporter permease [Nonomuraea ferruginea]